MLVGFTVSMIEGAVCLWPIGIENVTERDIRSISFGTCVTGFAVAYRVATRLYARWGSAVDRSELAAMQQAHMAVLHVMGAIYTVVGIVKGVNGANFAQPMLLIGIALLGFGVREFYVVWRQQRRAAVEGV
jgi:hypothetical protein